MDLSSQEQSQLKQILQDRQKELAKEREEKILLYEEFINEKLKASLQRVLALRDSVYQEIADYLDVRNAIMLMKESPSPKTSALVPLGPSNEFFARAKIPSTEYILLEVGLGFVAQYTLDEALAIIALKEESLNKKAATYTNEITNIKARIKLMLHGLSELMNLPDPASG